MSDDKQLVKKATEGDALVPVKVLGVTFPMEAKQAAEFQASIARLKAAIHKRKRGTRHDD